MDELHAVGKRLERVDARAKVIGTARYVDDIPAPGALDLKVVASPHPHAKIKSICTKAAKASPGVVAVLTAADIPGENLVPLVIPDLTLLAPDRVRFVGDPVALVVAESPAQAEAGVAAVEVDYEVLDAVFDTLEALKPGAPVITQAYTSDDTEQTGANLFNHLQLKRGDLEAGFDAADVVIEQEYRTPYQAHAYLET